MGSSALGDEENVVDEIGNVLMVTIMVMKQIGGSAFRRCMMKCQMKVNA